MRFLTISLVTIIIVLSYSQSYANASLNSLDDLVKQVRKNSVLESRELAKRERVFRQQRDKRAGMLNKIKAQLAREKQRGHVLKQHYEENEAIITKDSELLHEKWVHLESCLVWFGKMQRIR